MRSFKILKTFLKTDHFIFWFTASKLCLTTLQNTGDEISALATCFTHISGQVCKSLIFSVGFFIRFL